MNLRKPLLGAAAGLALFGALTFSAADASSAQHQLAPLAGLSLI